MAIQYDFLALPGGGVDEGGDKPLYPKVVKCSTVSFKQLAEDISQGTSFTVADVVGMMDAIVAQSAVYLNNSCHVELGGLGTLSLGIACDKDPDGHQPVITEAGQVKPHHLHVTKVLLNAKPEFMQTLQGPFERAKEGFPSNTTRIILDAGERRAALLDYLAETPTITIRRYAALTGLSQRKASRELHALADPASEDSILVKSGSGPHLIFVRKG